MAEFQAGEVVVPVVPDARNFLRDLKKQVLGDAYKAGQEIGKEIHRGISDQLKGVYDPLKEETRKQQQQAPRDGEQVAGAFARGFKKSLQAAFQSLPKAEIDADSTGAQAKIQELRARMQELSDKTVGVDLDAGEALAQVQAIQRELSALDNKDASADVRVDIASALTELASVEASIARLDGQVARPRVDIDVSGAMGAIASISAGLAGLAAIPVAATVGAGIAGLAAPLAAAGVGFAGLAAVAVPSVNRISEAVKAHEAAQKAAATATSGGAQAAAQAASQALALASAEQRVVDAKRTAKTAEEDLTRARQEAKRAMEELNRAVQNAALDEESALLSVEEARQRLAEIQADPKSTELERRRAELDVRMAEQRAKDAKARTKQLQQDQKQADKAGIEGSAQVLAAKEKIEQANRRVAESEAQLRVAQLQSAAAAQTATQAQRNLAYEVAKLSPSAKYLAAQWMAFSKVYEAWQRDLEPDVLPVLGKGLTFIEKLLPKLSPIIRGVSGALGGLLDSATKALGGKFWTSFFNQINKEAPGIVTGLGKSFMNVVSGIAGIIKAFLPFSGTVVGGIQDATKAFSDWGKSLGQSEGFKTFIAYVQANAPKVFEIVRNIATVIGNLLTGLSGSGAGALDMIVSISQALAELTPGQLQAIALAAAGVFVAFKAWKAIAALVGGARLAIQGATAVVKGAQAVWGGLGTAASKAAGVAKTAGSGIATAARTAGSVVAKGASAAWTGIGAAASRAAALARIAGAGIVTAGKIAATAAVSLGRVALGYASIAAQALIARTRTLLAAAAQAIIRGATIAWTAVQWLLNAALNANPIGLIVLAITALVAALIYAWNNSETFRNIVLGAWEAIKTAVQTAWTNFIQPALQAMWEFITNTLAPIFSWLWNSVVKPAWDGIAAAVQWAWQNIIQPAVALLVAYWKNVLGPVFTWLWNNIVKPAFDGIGRVIQTAWTSFIKPAVEALWGFIKNTLAPVFSWLWNTIIKPAWDGIGAVIKGAWDKVIKPTFDFLHDMIFKTIPDGFKTGVEKIGQFWDGLKEAARKPVQFVVDTVYNNGIAAIWNAVADTLKLPKLPLLKFASGGIYPGYTPGKDIGVAAVSGGEAIMRPEWTKAVGEKYVHGANAAARKGGVDGVAKFLGVAGDPGPSFAGGFASGGIVGDLKNLLSGGIKLGAEKILYPLLDRAKAAMGGTKFGDLMFNVPKTMVDATIKMLGEREEKYGGASQHAAVKFARAQIGKPYKWGATGPDSYDCSGLTMRSLQAAGVQNVPRVTYDQIKMGKAVQAPLAGDLGFPHSGHVWLYSAANKIIEAPYTGAHVREVAARNAMAIRRPSYDDGGYLMPGTSLVHNGTGRPEPVLTDRQWQAVQSATQGGDGGPALVIEDFHATPTQSPQQIAQELAWLSRTR